MPANWILRKDGGKGGIIMDVKVGDVLQMKKPHPCGCREWKVLRVGMDFRLHCLGCGHEVMPPRVKVEKNIKKVLSEDGEKV